MPSTRQISLSALVCALLVSLAGCGTSTTAQPSRTGQISFVADSTAPRYVALGDSYTAGRRLGFVTDPRCRRTDGNYPHRLAATADLRLVDASCGGARIRDLTHAQMSGVRPQLNAVTRTTSLVTLAIGGNDIDIVPLIEACSHTAGACARQVRRSQLRIWTLSSALRRAVKLIQRRAPAATVVVLGYPEVFTRGVRCGRVGLGWVERAADLFDDLNHSIRTAATATGSTYLDVDSLTEGHGLCTSAPWIAGRTTWRTQRFHPMIAEQKAVALALEHLVASPSTPTPTPSPTLSPTPTPSEPTPSESESPTASPTVSDSATPPS